MCAYSRSNHTLHGISPETQARLDALMTASNAGTLTPTEREELRRLTDEIEMMALENARLLARQRQRLESASVRTSRSK